MVSTTTVTLSAVSIAVFAYWIPTIQIIADILYPPPMAKVEKVYKKGRNNTVLLLGNGDFGLGNVVLATGAALIEEQPQLEVHYGTFNKFTKPIQRVNELNAENGLSNSVHAHIFESKGFSEIGDDHYGTIQGLMHPPGLKGFKKYLNEVKWLVQPLELDQYLANYREALELIEKVDPQVIAIEPMFSPGVDAAIASKRRYVMLSPNALRDAFAVRQPYAAGLWKYPVMASGLQFPIPWWQIPINIYMNLMLGYAIAKDPRLNRITAGLKENGIEKPYSLMDVFYNDIPWLSAGSLEADFPMSVLPDHAIACGPIYLKTAPVAKQDPEMAAWLKERPTIMINQGSHADYSEEGAKEMLEALRYVFDTTDQQVLWKFKKRSDYSDDFQEIVATELKNGRLKLTPWIKADPSAILESGEIALSVHHGGANSYFEAVASGVPHLILPMWADCYDYASRAEYLKIGVYGNAKAAPNHTAQELIKAFSRVLGDGPESRTIRENAARLGEFTRRKPGRSRAAQEIARWANNEDL